MVAFLEESTWFREAGVPILVTLVVALVEEHIRCENDHDLESILGTFGATPRYDDAPNDEHHLGVESIHRC